MLPFFKKLRLSSIGEIAIPEKNPAGNGYINKPGKKIEETTIPRNFVVNISDCCTGFILKRINPTFITDYGMYALALVVTAAHVVFDVIDSSNKFLDSRICKVDGIDADFHGLILKTYHEKYPGDALSSNGVSYCAGEGDLALILLLSKSNLYSFNELNLDYGNYSIGNECCVAGYPQRAFHDPMYNYPSANNVQEARKSLDEIFTITSEIIVSQGHIKWSGTVIEVACSACPGMSGSPVIYNNSIIGVLVGGPALKGQRELFMAAKELCSNNIIDSLSHFNNFLRYKDLYHSDPEINYLCDLYSLMLKSPILQVSQTESTNFIYKTQKGLAIENLISIITSLAISINDKTELSHNSALNIGCPAFQEIIIDVQILMKILLGLSEVSASSIVLV